MDLIQALRHPWSKETDKVFTNKFGEPIVADHFRKDYWDRILKAVGVGKRKFYATRHTFITHCVEAGYSLKEIADYAGTSVAMIEQSYCARQTLDPDRAPMPREIFERYSEKPLKTLASPTDAVVSRAGFEPATLCLKGRCSTA
jgi:integrase